MDVKDIQGPEHLSILLGWDDVAMGPNNSALHNGSVRIPSLDRSNTSWYQPNNYDFIVEVDKQYPRTGIVYKAYARQIIINNLLEYSGTVPSGVYAGKMWRSEYQSLIHEGGKLQYLHWYELDKERTDLLNIVSAELIPLEVIALLHD